MNTTQAAKVDKLLNHGIPTKERTPRAVLKNVTYIDPRHIMLVRISDGCEGAPEHVFDGVEEREDLNTTVFNTTQTYPWSAYNRKELISILEAMDSDTVVLHMMEEAPVFIEGRQGDGELKIEAVLAPRIYDGDVAFYD